MSSPIRIEAINLEIPYTLSQFESKKIEIAALVATLGLTFEGEQNLYDALIRLGIDTALGESYDNVEVTIGKDVAPLSISLTEEGTVAVKVANELPTSIIAVEPNTDLSVTIEESNSVDVKNKQQLKVTVTNENLTAAAPTLQAVTDAGNTTTNSITTGSVTANGNFLIAGTDSTVQLKGTSVDFSVQTAAAANVARIATTTGGSARLDLLNQVPGFNGALEFRATSFENNALEIRGGSNNDTKLLVSRDSNSSTLQVTGNSIFTGNARVTGAFQDTSGDAGTAGQVLSSTASGTNWISTSYTPDVWQVDDVSDCDTDRLLVFDTVNIVNGTTGTNANAGTAGMVRISSAGTYEITYSVNIKARANITTRQSVMCYIEDDGTKVPGSSSATYLRLPGANQGGFTAMFNTSYVTVGANSDIALRIFWLDGNTKSLDIYKANGIQNTVSIRRIV